MPEGLQNRFGVAAVHDMIYVLGGESAGDAQTVSAFFDMNQRRVE